MAWRIQNAEALIQIQQQHDIYTTYKKPIDIELAEMHLRATNTGANLSSIVGDKICACCGYHFNKKELSFGNDVNEFRYMGYAYPLLFKYAVFAVVTLVFVAFLMATPMFLGFPARIDCLFSKCPTADIYRYIKTRITLVICLTTICLVGLILMKLFFARKIYTFKNRLSKFLPNPQDFTLLVSGLLNDEYIKDVQDKFTYQDGTELKVVKIDKIYDINDYVKLTKKYVLEHHKLKEIELSYKRGSRQHENQYDILSKAKIELLDLAAKLEKSGELKYRFTGNCFVTFDTVEDCEKALEMHERVFINPFSAPKVRACRTSAPSDIVWTNFHYSLTSRMFRKIILSTAMSLIILLTSLVSKVIKSQELTHGPGSSTEDSLLFEVLIALWIVFMNYVMDKSTSKLIKYEQHRTYTSRHVRSTMKKTVGIWLNSVFSLLVINYSDGHIDYYGSSGIGRQVQMFYVINMLATFLVNILKYQYFRLIITRSQIRKDVKQQKDPKFFQYEAHKYFENRKFNYVNFQSTFLSATATALFFAVALPETIILGIFNVIVIYCVFKWMFVYRSSIPRDHDISLISQAVNYFNIPIFAFCLGFFIYDSHLFGRISIYAVVIVAIGLLQLLVPDEKIMKMFFRPNADTPKTSFENSQLKFSNDYDRLNPVSQYRAYHKWLKHIKIIDTREKLIPCDDRQYEQFDTKNLLQTIYDYVTVYKKNRNLVRIACENPFSVLKTDQFDVLEYFNFYKLEKNALIEYQAYKADYYHQILENSHDKSNPYVPLSEEPQSDERNASSRKNTLFNNLVYSDIAAINRELKFEKKKSFDQLAADKYGEEYKMSSKTPDYEKSILGLKRRLFEKFAKNSYFLNFDPSTIDKDDTNVAPQLNEPENTLMIPEEIDNRRKVLDDVLLETSFRLEKKKLTHQPTVQIKQITPILSDQKAVDEEFRSNNITPLKRGRMSITPDRFINDLSVILEKNVQQ